MSRTRIVLLAIVAGVVSLGLMSMGRPASAAVPQQAAGTATATSTAPAATSTSTSVIPPPPPPPTTAPVVTATAAVTATATATPVPTALGAQALLVARSSVTRAGKTAVVTWKMAYQLGVKGFRIYAKQRNLTPHLIRPHSSRTYTARVAWTNAGRYTLHILFKNGHLQTEAIH